METSPAIPSDKRLGACESSGHLLRVSALPELAIGIAMAREEIDVFNLSFIDVLSCTLGGVLLLLITFSSIIKASAERAVAAETSLGGEFSGPNLAAGDIAPPPDPLVIQIEQSGLATARLESKLLIALDNRPVELTRNRPFWRGQISGKRRFIRALFSTTPQSNGCLHTILIPNARALLTDEQQQEIANSRARRWPKSFQGWEVQVRYPDPRTATSTTAAIAKRTRLLVNWDKIRNVKSWLYVGNSSPSLADAFSGGLQQSIGGTEVRDPDGGYVLQVQGKALRRVPASWRNVEGWIKQLAAFDNSRRPIELYDALTENDPGYNDVIQTCEVLFAPLANKTSLAQWLRDLRKFRLEMAGVGAPGTDSVRVKVGLVRVPGGKQISQALSPSPLTVGNMQTFELR